MNISVLRAEGVPAWRSGAAPQEAGGHSDDTQGKTACLRMQDVHVYPCVRLFGAAGWVLRTWRDSAQHHAAPRLVEET